MVSVQSWGLVSGYPMKGGNSSNGLRKAAIKKEWRQKRRREKKSSRQTRQSKACGHGSSPDGNRRLFQEVIVHGKDPNEPGLLLRPSGKFDPAIKGSTAMAIGRSGMCVFGDAAVCIQKRPGDRCKADGDSQASSPLDS